MKTPFTLAITAGCLLLAGCTFSLNPIYTDKDLVHDPALVGTWTGPTHEDGVWKFERLNEDKTYQLVIKSGKNTAPFKACLVQLGQHRFLDLFPQADAYKSAMKQAGLGEFFQVSFLPGHWIYKVEQIEPELRLVPLDDDWVKALLEREPGATPHCLVGQDSDEPVLTGSTADLQAFLRKHADSAEAFDVKNTTGLKRQPPAQP